MMNGSIQQGDMTNNYLCTQQEEPKYLKQTLTDLKGETDFNTFILDFNTPLT